MSLFHILVGAASLKVLTSPDSDREEDIEDTIKYYEKRAKKKSIKS